MTAHLTGQYPAWWEGRRFEAPISAWLAGKSAVTTRDIIQHALLGDPTTHDPGMMPEHLVVNTSAKAGIADAIDTVWIQHVERYHGAPALSIAPVQELRSRPHSLRGDRTDVIWLDEEPDEAIENECLVRTMTCQGIVLIKFTPLQGLTTFVQEFLETAVMYVADGALVDAHAGFWGQADAMFRPPPLSAPPAQTGRSWLPAISDVATAPFRSTPPADRFNCGSQVTCWHARWMTPSPKMIPR